MGQAQLTNEKVVQEQRKMELKVYGLQPKTEDGSLTGKELWCTLMLIQLQPSEPPNSGVCTGTIVSISELSTRVESNVLMAAEKRNIDGKQIKKEVEMELEKIG